MLASRLASRTITLSEVYRPKFKNVSLVYRSFNSQPKEGVFRRASRMKDTVATQLSGTSFTFGRGLVAGASALGLGSLIYYGVIQSNRTGFIDRTSLWPNYVRERISSTYQYFGASLGITAASALAVARTPALMNFVSRSSLLAMVASFAAVIGSGMLVRSIPYEKGTFGSKQLAWAVHAGILGAFVAPLTLLGGPLLVRAAWYTAGVVGGLSALAATAPSEKFLNMGGPLAVGLGVVFAASVGGAFFPPTTRLGLNLYSISIYGGLVLFSMLLLYDTQKIVKKSESAMHYDPVNESISIYMDVLNIFMRIAMIMANGNRRK